MENIFFATSVVLLFIEIYLYEKSTKKLNGIKWTLVSFILTLNLIVFLVGISNLLNIPFNLINMTIINGVVVTLGAFYLHRKPMQKYYWEKNDFFFLSILAIICMGAAFWQFGSELNLFNYESGDANNHLNWVLEAIKNEKVDAMYYMQALTALLVEVLNPLIHQRNIKQVYMFMDIIFLFFQGSIFWFFIRQRTMGKKTRILAMLITIIYMIGYPLCSMVFGFFYLGAGVLSVILISLLLQMNSDGKITPFFLYGAIIITGFALMVSYILFTPPVLVGIVIYFWKKKNKKIIISKKKTSLMIAASTLILLLGSIYFYLGFIVSRGHSISDIFIREGYCYKSFLGDFLFFIPLLIWYFFNREKKEKDTMEYMGGSVGIFVLIMLLGSLFQKVSSYYYYKNYHILWIFFCYFLWKGARRLLETKTKLFVGFLAYCICLTFITIVAPLNKELEINLTGYFLPIIKNNYQYASLYNPSRISNQGRILYDAVANISEQEKCYIPLLTQGEDRGMVIFYYTLSGQYELEQGKYEHVVEFVSEYNRGQQRESLEKISKMFPYLTVMYGDPVYQDNWEWFEQFEVVTDSGNGMIVKTQ